jgi:hypothetical protein
MAVKKSPRGTKGPEVKAKPVRAKSAGAKKKPPRPVQTGREALAKELSALIPPLDEEGLRFLIEQAKIHLYNMRIDELRTAAEERGGAGKAAGSREGSSPAALRIEASESGGFYLVAGREWIMFSRIEAAQLSKIVHGPGTVETRERLLAWLDRERRDVFAALPVRDKFDDRLKKLAALFKAALRQPGTNR